MKGSEKQVEWAESIKQGWINGLNGKIAESADRVARNSMPAEWLEAMTKTANQMIENLNKIDDAKMIIDNRKWDVAGNCMSAAIAAYDELKK